jgi:hypothetical protein
VPPRPPAPNCDPANSPATADHVLLGHLDGKVGELARACTNSPSRFEVAASVDEPGEIEHRFVPVTPATKMDTLVEHIRASTRL